MSELELGLNMDRLFRKALGLSETGWVSMIVEVNPLQGIPSLRLQLSDLNLQVIKSPINPRFARVSYVTAEGKQKRNAWIYLGCKGTW